MYDREREIRMPTRIRVSNFGSGSKAVRVGPCGRHCHRGMVKYPYPGVPGGLKFSCVPLQVWGRATLVYEREREVVSMPTTHTHTHTLSLSLSLSHILTAHWRRWRRSSAKALLGAVRPEKACTAEIPWCLTESETWSPCRRRTRPRASTSPPPPVRCERGPNSINNPTNRAGETLQLGHRLPGDVKSQGS